MLYFKGSHLPLQQLRMSRKVNNVSGLHLLEQNMSYVRNQHTTQMFIVKQHHPRILHNRSQDCGNATSDGYVRDSKPKIDVLQKLVAKPSRMKFNMQFFKGAGIVLHDCKRCCG
jgi:hypothetical protein